MVARRHRWVGSLVFVTVGACVAIGCRWGTSEAQTSAPPSSTPESKPPTSGPTSVTWDASAKGVKLQYPSDWHTKKNPDYELMLLPAGAANEDRRVTVDIPDLPPHLPFMIQMKRVEHDYLEDLKKAHPDLQTKEDGDAKLPECTAKLVRSVWHQGKQQHNDVALLMIHASSVYILDARSDEDHLAPTRATFDSIRESIVWTKH